jgi:AbrB family looped-hinge helix DNA binding protein
MKEAGMLVAKSKVTSQGQISVPAEVRRDLGVRTGTELVWDRQENGDYVVRVKRFTLDDLYELVGDAGIRLADEDIKAARRAFLGSRMKRLKG